jgi:hypothetical protein
MTNLCQFPTRVGVHGDPADLEQTLPFVSPHGEPLEGFNGTIPLCAVHAAVIKRTGLFGLLRQSGGVSLVGPVGEVGLILEVLDAALSVGDEAEAQGHDGNHDEKDGVGVADPPGSPGQHADHGADEHTGP